MKKRRQVLNLIIYIWFVRIFFSWLPKDEILREELIKIKEKKIIFTNGSHAHVENVTKQLGIDGLFDGVFDITDANYIPKPHLDPCLLYTSPSPRDLSTSRMPSSA